MTDERQLHFPTSIWLNNEIDSRGKYFVLDVGCSTGKVTQQLYLFLTKYTSKEVIILGIDIDPDLISQAKKTNLYPNNVFYQCLDIMTAAGDSVFQEHLKRNEKLRFDAVFGLLITMLIHLSHGDKGLREFLRKIGKLSELLILEVHPWESYIVAEQEMRDNSSCDKNDFDVRCDYLYRIGQFELLQIREKVEIEIENILSEFDLQKIYDVDCRTTLCGHKNIRFYRHIRPDSK